MPLIRSSLVPSLHDINSIVHAAFHDWHWHKQQYLMASSTFMSVLAVFFSIYSSKRSAQISIRSQILGICDSYVSSIPDSFPKLGTTSPLSAQGNETREFYSKMVTLVQIIDSSGLDLRNRTSIKEFFWLQRTAIFWDEIAEGAGYLYATNTCFNEAHKETLDGHRRTVCQSFIKIIKKHKGKKFPINVPPKGQKK